MKNLKKKVDDEKLNGVELLRELKRSKQEKERLKHEKKLLRPTTKGAG